jgi:excisionase family DNA binding protein
MSTATVAGSLVQPQYLTYREASFYLGVSERFLAKAKAKGKLPFVQFGGRVRFSVAALDTFAKSHEFWAEPAEK